MESRDLTSMYYPTKHSTERYKKVQSVEARSVKYAFILMAVIGLVYATLHLLFGIGSM